MANQFSLDRHKVWDKSIHLHSFDDRYLALEDEFNPHSCTCLSEFIGDQYTNIKMELYNSSAYRF